ncbi:MAG: hypothetical protein LKI72_07250, partial [Prevotella sp.]|nr:hypothetical protein [Prevotella sp.]
AAASFLSRIRKEKEERGPGSRILHPGPLFMSGLQGERGKPLCFISLLEKRRIQTIIQESENIDF